MSGAHEQDRLRRLLDVGRALVSELDPELVLQRVLEEARALTGARYAALGILDEQRRALERFVTSGLDPDERRAIGHLPRGRGVLGVLIRDPQPLRLEDVGAHPHSYGFPAAHPPMSTFLGVPVLIRGEAWGNLYLTEKQDGAPFSAADEESVVVLAEWAATAIDNARLYDRSEHRRRESEQAVRALEAARDVADAVGDESALDRVLELIVKRGRALVEARTVLIMLREAEDLVLKASAGEGRPLTGHRLPIAASTAGAVLRAGAAERFDDARASLRIAPSEFGLPDAQTALLVPMLHRGEMLGVLAAFDRGAPSRSFSDADERVLSTFASAAANAVALKQSVEADRLRSAFAAADAERGRWARELHDQTLQALGGLRIMLASAVRGEDPERLREAVSDAIAETEVEIANLRSIISDLRPSLLDDLGLQPALEALVERRRTAGLEVECRIELEAAPPLSAEIDTTIYRLVQEALTNVAKHAGAAHARVCVKAAPGELVVEIQDDGHGFDPRHRSAGFGLQGMRERVFLAGGSMELTSGRDGTRLRSRLPLPDGPEPAAGVAAGTQAGGDEQAPQTRSTRRWSSA